MIFVGQNWDSLQEISIISKTYIPFFIPLQGRCRGFDPLNAHHKNQIKFNYLQAFTLKSLPGLSALNSTYFPILTRSFPRTVGLFWDRFPVHTFAYLNKFTNFLTIKRTFCGQN